MYKLALGNALEGNDELHKLGELLVTETIKANVINGYFKEDSEVNIPIALAHENSFEEIKNLVDITKAENLLTLKNKQHHDIQEDEVVEKLAKLIQILYAEEADNPGEVIEYLLYRMIEDAFADEDGYYMSPIVDERLEEFIKLLTPHIHDKIIFYNENLDEGMTQYSLEDIPKEIEKYVGAVSEFPLLYGVEKLGDEYSLILWDTDFLMYA